MYDLANRLTLAQTHFGIACIPTTLSAVYRFRRVLIVFRWGQTSRTLSINEDHNLKPGFIYAVIRTAVWFESGAL